MRVPYSWLMEYLQADIGPAELARELTMGGLEVEEIQDWTSEDGKATDQVLVTSVTSNRGDLLSMVGVARHAAAVLGASWQMPQIDMGLLGEPVRGQTVAATEQVRIELANPSGCPRYCGLMMDGVQVADSPDWMAHRLDAAGMRPIANLVDCTNYVMLELGQPLHGFDYSLLQDGHIIVRSATDGEQILTLDQQWRTMTESDLLIADSAGPVAIAGVMGGADTEMSWKTTKILLESAHFDPTSIRKTRLRLGLASEASHRFERVVDPDGTLRALARVAGLLQETAGGSIIGPAADACVADVSPRTIVLRAEHCNRVLGTALSAAQMQQYLEALGFETQIEADGRLQVAVPTYRPDVEREIDLVEEVAIVHGYQKIPTTVPGRLIQSGRLTPAQKFERRARATLRAAGLNETISYSMVSQRDLDRMGYTADAPERDMLALANPGSDEQSHMRSRLLPSLLQAAEHNQHQRVESVRLYEIARVFMPVANDKLPCERLHAAGLMMGPYWSSSWNLPDESREPDFYTVKGTVEQLVGTLGVDDVSYRSSDHPTMHPGQCAEILLGDRSIGIIGKLSSTVQAEYDLDRPAYAFELDLDALIECAGLYSEYQRLPRFPAALRDLAVVVDDTTENTAEALQQTVEEAGGEYLAEVTVFDVYADAERLGEGMKSVALSLTFRRSEGTLTDEQVDQQVSAIVAHLEEKLGAQLRA